MALTIFSTVSSAPLTKYACYILFQLSTHFYYQFFFHLQIASLFLLPASSAFAFVRYRFLSLAWILIICFALHTYIVVFLPDIFPQIFAYYFFPSFYCTLLLYCLLFVFIVLSITLLIIISIIYYICKFICHCKFQSAQIFTPVNIALCLLRFFVCCCIMHIDINSVLFLFCILI